MSVSKLLSRIVAPYIDKEKLTTAKQQQEELILHDHTYGITSDPLTQFSVVLSALIHDGKIYSLATLFKSQSVIVLSVFFIQSIIVAFQTSSYRKRTNTLPPCIKTRVLRSKTPSILRGIL